MIDSGSIIIACLYIPPGSHVSTYESIYEYLTFTCSVFDNPILIVGDFNLASYSSYLESAQGNPLINSLNNFCQFLNLSQYNYVLNYSERILDLVLCNNTCQVTRLLDPFVDEDAHHPALNISFKICFSLNLKHNFETSFSNCYDFRKANFPLLYEGIANIDWTSLEASNNANDACTYFYNKLYNLFELYVPTKMVQTKRKYPIWYSRSIISDIRQKSIQLKRYKQTSDQNARSEFERLRSKIKRDVDKAYKSFVDRSENEIKKDPNKFWAFVGNKNGSTAISNRMNYNGKILENSIDILNGFADFFSCSYIDSSTFVPSFNEVAASDILHIREFGETEVLQALKRVKPKMTTGPDDIPAFILKDCASVLSHPLHILFNICLKSGVVPDVWKVSKIRPIYKKGDKDDISNFRAITIVSNFCKLFEVLLYDSIYSYMSNRLTSCQHGFVKGRSTVTNLVNVTQFIAETLDRGTQADVIYMDFSKAFDKLDHGILLTKLSMYGFSPSLITLLQSYLSGRTSYVEFNGLQSNSFIVKSGVPQGSNLGPLLFNIFINDIVEDVNVNCLLYADDLKIYAEIENISSCEQISLSLRNIENWCKLNRLPLNPSKCKVMSFTLRRQAIISQYAISDALLERTSLFTDLGVTFDPQLSFVQHVQTISSDANKKYGFIARIGKVFTDNATLKILFNAYVRSRLEYACLVWNPAYQVHIVQLENVQRRFLKLLSFRVDHIYPPIGIPNENLLLRHETHSLRSRRECQTIIFLHKILRHVTHDSGILERLAFNIPRSTSRSNLTFYLPTPRTNLLKYSPVYNICNIYNASASQLDIFNCTITAIKSHYLNFR